jgi:hypothetical protein
MDVKGKRIVNASAPEVIAVGDPLSADKVKQVVTYGFLNTHALTTVPEDRDNLYANNKYIYEVDTFIHKQSDLLIPDPLEPGKTIEDEAKLEKFLS